MKICSDLSVYIIYIGICLLNSVLTRINDIRLKVVHLYCSLCSAIMSKIPMSINSRHVVSISVSLVVNSFGATGNFCESVAPESSPVCVSAQFGLKASMSADKSVEPISTDNRTM